jgi:hypothetical protein
MLGGEEMIIKTKKQLLKAITKMVDATGVDQYILKYNEEEKVWATIMIDPAHVTQLSLQLRSFETEDKQPLEMDQGALNELLPHMADGEVQIDYHSREFIKCPDVKLNKIKLRYHDDVDGGRTFVTPEYVGECVSDPKAVKLTLPVKLVLTTERLQKAFKYVKAFQDVRRLIYDPEMKLAYLRSKQLVDKEKDWGFSGYCLGIPREIGETQTAMYNQAQATLSKDEVIASIFPNDYLEKFVKGIDKNLFPDLELHFGIDLPLRMILVGSDGSKVEYLVAPRIENDD